MKIKPTEILRRLGAKESIDSICQAAGIDREGFELWWITEAASRVPDMTGDRLVEVNSDVRIDRDEWGIPHVFADNDRDLFFGFGYAMAQDRLFQLDYLRRKATGRLSEVLGKDGLESDLLVRTVGIHRIAASEENCLPLETRHLLEAFSKGINAVIKEMGDHLPIEFSLLDYRPEPWSPLDSLAIQCEFAWYLTGRFPVIVGPELAKRILGDGDLYKAFLQGEADEESILPAGSYPLSPSGSDPVGATVGDPDEGQGSNNWVISGSRSVTGKPLLASDPHIAFGAVSCWYEVHLCGGSFNVTGACYSGVPAVHLGRNEHVAWGITNNICSQRDLYQEKTDAHHPGCFLYDDRWEPARKLVEVIRVKDNEPVTKVICFSRNGPIVDDILPPAARNTGPVSLRWLGATYSGWLSSTLRINRSKKASEFRQALAGWKCPTWSLVFADIDGHIGYQSAGQIPIRKQWERGYRPGWDPQHQWVGLVPFEGMPHLMDPERGWIATANNRPAADDFPYPLSGTWSSGHRARRIRQMIEAKDRLSQQDFLRMHQDTLSLRAVECVPKLLQLLEESGNERQEVAQTLETWNCRMETDQIGATVFEIFFTHWSHAVARERFGADLVDFVAGMIGGLASALLKEDRAGWFRDNATRRAAILGAVDAAWHEMSQRLGPEPSQWTWGNAHRIQLKHLLSARGDLGQLLDRGGQPVAGNGVTVCNTGYDPNWGALLGANYRLIADLSETSTGLWAVDAQGVSGHPGSCHYCDQLVEWMNARYHPLPLDKETSPPRARTRLILRSTAA